MDLQSWALDEPERWARWAAPCPIPPSDLRGFGRRRRGIKERMVDRVRQRQPLLSTLVAHVEEHYTGLRDLLAAARAAPLDGVCLSTAAALTNASVPCRGRRCVRP